MVDGTYDVQDERTLSLVGRSAVEFAAHFDPPLREKMFEILLEHDQLSAVDLANAKDWWDALEEALRRESLDAMGRLAVIRSIGSKLPLYPRILAEVVETYPQDVAFNVTLGTYADDLRSVWDALEPQFDKVAPDLSLTVIKVLLQREIISGNTALDLAKRGGAKVEQRADDGTGRPSHAYDDLLPELFAKLSIPIARHSFGELINLDSLVFSSATYRDSAGFSFVHYAGQNLYDCAKGIVQRMSSTVAIAWAERTLVEANVRYAKSVNYPYTGFEWSGSGHAQIGNNFYEDNGWLLNVIVPLLTTHFESLSDAELLRWLTRGSGSTIRHPVFMTRAAILALPDDALNRYVEPLVTLASLKGGIPSMADAVARRAKDSILLAKRYLAWRIAQAGCIVNPDEAALVHMVIRSDRQLGLELARQLVSHPQFSAMEGFQLGFFSQLDWAADDPVNATDLVLIAVRGGYAPKAVWADNIIKILQYGLQSPEARDRILKEDKVRPYLAEAWTPGVRGDTFTIHDFEALDEVGKVSMLHKLEHADLDFALELISVGLADPNPAPDSDLERSFTQSSTSVISGVRVTAYWAYIQLIQRFGLEPYLSARFDIHRLVESETGAYAAHFGVMALSALYRVAYQAERLSITDRIIESVWCVSEKITHRQVDEDLAQIILWHWKRLDPEVRDKAWHRFGSTERMAGFALHLMITTQDRSCERLLVTLCTSDNKKIRRWLAWAVWQRLVAENRAELDSLANPQLMAVMDALISRPDSDVYMTLARLIADQIQANPREGTGLLLKMIEKALDSSVSFYIPDDIASDERHVNKDQVINLGVAMANSDLPNDAYSMVSYEAKLLQEIIEPRYHQRVRGVFESLKQWPSMLTAYNQWRARISR